MSFDLTIETVLADPMIRAVMLADRVEPQMFERLLHAAARRIDEVGPERVLSAGRALAPASLVACRAQALMRGHCCA